MVTRRARRRDAPFGWCYTVLLKAGVQMARRCEICGKGPVVGRNVSHAHNVTRRRFEANIQTVRAVVNGAVKRLRVCTRCIRSNRITKAA